MLFNSFSFAVFLPIVFALYWLMRKNFRMQNVLLFVSSCYFYACWDYRFLFLLLFSIGLDYFSAIQIVDAKGPARKKFWLTLSIVINLGFLAVFKYYNFFVDSFADFLGIFGVKAHFSTLQVILPVGISFYTFHGLSYIIDIYKNRIKEERNFIQYSVFVSYFPLLVAGPIERATHLLPQIQKERVFSMENAAEGLRRILWGLFKKVVIADNCADFANQIFNHSADQSGSTLVLGALFFTFQIYCDFSGYSDIALGTSKLFGIDLLQNFTYPYFSRDIAEFWRRWHISLSSWFRDYLYIPLGGSKGGTWMKIRNTFIIFLVSGFWHGANWTFIVWGALNAIYFLPLLVTNRNRNNMDIVANHSALPSLNEFASMLVTFLLAVFAWIFFRAESMTHAFQYIGGIFSHTILSVPGIEQKGYNVLLLCAGFIMVEWWGRRHTYALQHLDQRMPAWLRWPVYYALALAVLFFAGEEQQFIYFQF